MEEKEKVIIAFLAINKNMDYETLKYSDYLFGRENKIDEVWKYVIEAQEQGLIWFRTNYSKYFK